MFGFVQPQYGPCGECGASVPVSEEDTHECDRQRWLDYQMLQHRAGVAQLEVELGVWLETPHGRFAVFYAERQRLREAGDGSRRDREGDRGVGAGDECPLDYEPFWHAGGGDVWEGGGT